MTVKIREKSANGQPPARSQFARTCRTCQADLLALAPGKTGESGLWSPEGWFCSIQCAPPELQAIARAEAGRPAVSGEHGRCGAPCCP